jgi:chaperonin GroES
MAFSLHSDRIAVIADPLETTTKSGIHLPETALDYNEPRYGTVAVVGIGHRSEATGELVPMDFAAGQRVFFHKGVGERWVFEDTEYLVLSPREIIGIQDTSLKSVK